VENEELGITGGNGEEMEREVRSARKAIELIGGGTNGSGVWTECLVEKVSDESNLRHVNHTQLLSQFANPSFRQTSWREGKISLYIS
jgi:hypothetical protein